MPSQYPYQETVRNEYLGVSKVIRAMTRRDIEWLMEAQLAKWEEQEARKREQRQKEATRQQAEEDTRGAQENIERFRTILTGCLAVNVALDWEQLHDRRSVAPFQFTEPKPDRDQIRLQLLGAKPAESLVVPPVPEEPGFLELFLPFLRRRRHERESEAAEAFKR